MSKPGKQVQSGSQDVLSFGDFRLDLARACLLRSGQEVKLRPKSFQALKYLVENPGRVIPKAELIGAIWPDAFVTDDSLVQCLRDIRRALADDSQQIIKTAPRRGYLFDGEVTAERPTINTVDTEEVAGLRLVIEGENKFAKESSIVAGSEGVRASSKARNGLRRYSRVAAVVLPVSIVVIAVTYISISG